MEARVFNKFRDIIFKESGIVLNDSKKELVANRIRKRLRTLNLSAPEEYLEIIESDLEGYELVHLLDAISTNHTFFYRENEHFNIFAKRLLDLKKKGQNSFKVWCAASSTGEEPYTILMTAADNLDLVKCDFKLLATDICLPVLETASEGEYELSKMTGVSPSQREKYFDVISTEDKESVYKIKKSLRKNVLFKRFNLNNFPYQLKGSFDFIFCRNVMIYFDDNLRRRIVSEMQRLLKPGGVLFIGHSENIGNFSEGLKKVATSVFAKEG